MSAKTDTKESILRQIRNTDKPAVSAAQLADEIEVSVHTINKHVESLVDEDRVQDTKIGNATAYYIPYTDLPSHKKPDHTCARCGRDINTLNDFAKITVDRYYNRHSRAMGEADFYVFCRFCQHDLVGWIYDEGAIGDYYDVHGWDIPREQLEEVRNDPDIRTAPDDLYHLSDEQKQAYYVIEETQEDSEGGWVPEDEVLHRLSEIHGIHEKVAEQAVNQLSMNGFIDHGLDVMQMRYRTAE